MIPYFCNNFFEFQATLGLISFTDRSLHNKDILKEKFSRVYEKNIHDLQQFS